MTDPEQLGRAPVAKISDPPPPETPPRFRGFGGLLGQKWLVWGKKQVKWFVGFFKKKKGLKKT